MNEAKAGKLLPIRNQINIVYVNSLIYKIVHYCEKSRTTRIKKNSWHIICILSLLGVEDIYFGMTIINTLIIH